MNMDVVYMGIHILRRLKEELAWATIYIKSFVDFVDDHSIMKLFLQSYLCTRRVIGCERTHYENFLRIFLNSVIYETFPIQNFVIDKQLWVINVIYTTNNQIIKSF